MWTDPIVEQIHQTRVEITRAVGDNSHALTLAAKRTREHLERAFGMTWQPLPNRMESAMKLSASFSG